MHHRQTIIVLEQKQREGCSAHRNVLMSFVQQLDDTKQTERERVREEIFHGVRTAMLENVAPTAEKKIRDCLCMIE